MQALAAFLGTLFGAALKAAGPEFLAAFTKALTENRGEIAKPNSDLQGDPDLAALVNADGLRNQNDNRATGNSVQDGQGTQGRIGFRAGQRRESD